jgi:ATP-dependent Clp protease adaptor protein ClpS
VERSVYQSNKQESTAAAETPAGFAAPVRAGPRRDADPDREEGVAIRERPRTRRPPMYRVLLHNDDYTSMEFVVDALVRYFEKTDTEATHIMLQVHHAGVGVAGVYTRDEAETRVERVMSAAQAEGYPLLLTLEPE